MLNGIDTKIFYYRRKEAEQFRHSINIGVRKIVLHVTADFQNAIKGGKYITELSNRLDQNKYIVVVVDGNDNQKPEKFRGIYWGRAKSKDELAMLYSAADMTVLTSERETFSMVCAESLCCGTPVVGFCAGAPEMISLPEYSMFVQYGNIDELQEKIESIDDDRHEYVERVAEKKYSKESMVSDYIRIYKSFF